MSKYFFSIAAILLQTSISFAGDIQPPATNFDLGIPGGFFKAKPLERLDSAEPQNIDSNIGKKQDVNIEMNPSSPIQEKAIKESEKDKQTDQIHQQKTNATMPEVNLSECLVEKIAISCIQGNGKPQLVTISNSQYKEEASNYLKKQNLDLEKQVSTLLKERNILIAKFKALSDQVSIVSDVEDINLKEQINSGTPVIVVLKVQIRKAPSKTSDSIAIAQENEEVSMIETIGKWAKIRTFKGKVGFIPKNYVKEKDSIDVNENITD